MKLKFIANPMQFKTIIHPAEEFGYWAEVPEIPGCMTQGETLEELLANLQEAIAGCLAVDVPENSCSV